MLEQVQGSLRAEGVKGVLRLHKGRLYWRVVASVNGDDAKRRDIPLGLPGEHNAGKAAERIRLLVKEVESKGALTKPFPWEVDLVKKSGMTMGKAIRLFTENYWQGRGRTTSSEMTLERILNEFKRIPSNQIISLDIFKATVSSLPDNSRSRLECWKQYKRLAKLLRMDTDEYTVDSFFKTFYQTYNTKNEKNPPTDVELLKILDSCRWDEEFGWLTAAMAIYGCRPTEAFSLLPKNNSKAASVYTIKQKRGAAPELRTTVALMPEWVDRYDMQKIERFYSWNLPSYDPRECKSRVEKWRKWFQRHFGLSLYDLRHAWAIRSISMIKNPTLAAKCMGHSLAVHSRTYHRWMQADEVETAVELILRNNEIAMPTR